MLTDNLSATRDATGAPSGSNPGLGIAQILNAAGFTNISAARFFFNGIDTRTKGFDAIATYRTGLGDFGSLSLTAGYNWNDIDITGRRTNPGNLAQVPGIDLFGRLESLRIERGDLRRELLLALRDGCAALRKREFEALVSPGVHAAVERHGVRLVNYTELARA